MDDMETGSHLGPTRFQLTHTALRRDDVSSFGLWSRLHGVTQPRSLSLGKLILLCWAWELWLYSVVEWYALSVFMPRQSCEERDKIWELVPPQTPLGKTDVIRAWTLEKDSLLQRVAAIVVKASGGSTITEAVERRGVELTGRLPAKENQQCVLIQRKQTPNPKGK